MHPIFRCTCIIYVWPAGTLLIGVQLSVNAILMAGGMQTAELMSPAPRVFNVNVICERNMTATGAPISIWSPLAQSVLFSGPTPIGATGASTRLAPLAPLAPVAPVEG